MKKIGIVGARCRNSKEDFKLCEDIFLSVYEPGDKIVSGGCPSGGDRFAEVLAKKHQVPITIYYAQWDKIGKGAGFARNTTIANNSDILIAVVAPDRKGGTEDTIKKFNRKTLLKFLYLVPQVDSVDLVDSKDPVNSVESMFTP